MAIRADITVDDLKSYLAQVADFQSSSQLAGRNYERLVLAHGRAFKGARLPDGMERGTKHECFNNALLLAVGNHDLYYCEGFAYGVVPTHHAWCVDRNGRVIDPTWDEPERAVYAGLVMRTKAAMDFAIKRGYYGMLYTREFRPYVTGERSLKRFLVSNPPGLGMSDSLSIWSAGDGKTSA